MFMGWYSVDITKYAGTPPTTYYYTQSMCCPFKFGDILYDYSNIDNIRVNFDYSRLTSSKPWELIISQSDNTNINYQPIRYYNDVYSIADNYAYSYFYTKSTSIESVLYLKPVDTSHIKNGKYKCVSLNSLNKGFFILPFYSERNGKVYKYWNTKQTNNANFLIADSGIPSNSKYQLSGDKIAIGDVITYKDVIGLGVPADFATWFNANFQRVYENIYTIKSVTGETLTILTEAPPMTSATLSVVGNAKYLALKGENNTNYTMEWTSETPQGKIFAGLATSKDSSIIIPVGETSTINLTDSTDLYEVWRTYRPPTTTFDINLYKNSAEPNKVDKTAELSTVGTISGVLRQECSLINPEIIIQYDKPPDFNYCYIANFGRYYYVENIVSMRQNLWRVRLRCDVLMTYKTQILNLTARIARQQYTYTYRQIDSEIPFTNDPEIMVEDIPNSLNLGRPMDENILLTVVTNGT